MGDLDPNTPYTITVGDTEFTEVSDVYGVLYFEDDRSDHHTVIIGEDELPDGGSLVDAGGEDAGAEDAGTEDAGTEDAGTEDAGGSDAGSGDQDEADAGEASDADAEEDTGSLQGGCGCGATSKGSLCCLLGLLALFVRRRSIKDRGQVSSVGV